MEFQGSPGLTLKPRRIVNAPARSLTGPLSTFDQLLGRTMPELLTHVRVATEVEYALMGREGPCTPILWEVEYTDEFASWWAELTAAEKESIFVAVRMIEEVGPNLPFPRSGGVVTSRHANMRESLVQHGGRPLRTFYAFDPRRCAILLIGGDKTGDDTFYDRMVPIADRLYDEHLRAIRTEGMI